MFSMLQEEKQNRLEMESRFSEVHAVANEIIYVLSIMY